MTTDELILRAAENCEMPNLNALLENLRECNANQDMSVFADSLALLWEGFAEEPSFEQATFCLEVARLRVPDSTLFRQVLTTAIKTVLPPYLAKAGVLRALGLRDSSVAPAEVARRVDRLLAVKSGIVTFLPDSRRWGVITNIDTLNASVAVNLREGGALAAGIDQVLNRGYLFRTSVATEKLIVPAKRAKLTSHEFRRIVAEQAAVRLSDGSVKVLAEKLMTPECVAPAEFENWYSQDTPEEAPAPAPVRGSARSRSLKEMDLLLTQELKAGQKEINDAEVSSFAAFFERLKPEVAQRDSELLAGVIAKLADRVPARHWNAVFEPLKGKTGFWPQPADAGRLEDLEVWGELAVKLLNRLCAVTRAVFGDEYAAGLAVRLPLKSMNVCAEQLPAALLDTVFADPALLTGDLLLWIWKNRKNHPALEPMLKLENVAAALNQSRLPKEWGAAQRELHTLLLDKDDFQKYMVRTAGDDVTTLVGALAGASTFSTGERQSLLVKLSRHSDKIREHLEAGAASNLLGGKNSSETPAADEPIYTSLSSHRRLMQELHDIINIHQPENREALKTARAHGDFRENAEFDAAKERRNFLTRRRNELERDLARVNALDFRTVKPGKFIDFGVTVTLAVAGGADEVYYFLGAWDGDPDKKYLSYKTKLGAALRNRQVGDAIALPDGRKATVKSIAALPEEVLKDMD